MTLKNRLRLLPEPVRKLCAKLATMRMDHVTLAEQFLFYVRAQKLSDDPKKARRELAEHDRDTGDLLRLMV